MAHFELAGGQTSQAVQHRHVEELWFVVHRGGRDVVGRRGGRGRPRGRCLRCASRRGRRSSSARPGPARWPRSRSRCRPGRSTGRRPSPPRGRGRRASSGVVAFRATAWQAIARPTVVGASATSSRWQAHPFHDADSPVRKQSASGSGSRPAREVEAPGAAVVGDRPTTLRPGSRSPRRRRGSPSRPCTARRSACGGRRSRRRDAVEQLPGGQLAVEDVAADEAVRVLHVVRADHLPVQDRRREAGRDLLQLARSPGRRRRRARRVRLGRPAVRHPLREHRHHVVALRGQRGVEHAGDADVGERPASRPGRPPPPGTPAPRRRGTARARWCPRRRRATARDGW